MPWRSCGPGAGDVRSTARGRRGKTVVLQLETCEEDALKKVSFGLYGLFVVTSSSRASRRRKFPKEYTYRKWACGRLIRRAAMFFDKTSWNRPMERKRSNHRQLSRRKKRCSCIFAKYRIEMTQPRTKVVLQSRQFSAPKIAPRTTVVLQSRQFSASSSTACSAH